MSVAFSRSIAIDATPFYVGDYESFAFWYNDLGGGTTVLVEVSPVAVPAGTDWYTIAAAGVAGAILTDPSQAPVGQLAGWRAIWVRATALGGVLTITGSLK